MNLLIKESIIEIEELQNYKQLIENFLIKYINEEITESEWHCNRYKFDFDCLSSFTFTYSSCCQVPYNLFLYSKHLKEIDFSNNQLTTLAENLFIDCHVLMQINFDNNQLTNLPNNLFKSCKQLLFVNISNNKLKSLPNDLFIECKQLTNTYFSRNHLTNLPNDLFSECKQLAFVCFSKNQLANLSNKFFENCKHLKQVDFSNNQMSNVPNDLLVNLNELNRIDFSNNYLTNLSDGLFKDCIVLREVNFYNNQLTYIQKELFNDAKELEFVNFSTNQLTNISSDLFNECRILREVNFSNNLLTSLPEDIFRYCKKLATLNLFNNKLSNLSASFFSKCASLKYVNLSHNHFNHLPNILFQKCNNLEELNVSNNQLMSLSDDLLSCCNQLTFIDISHNQLTNLPLDLFKMCRQLRFIHSSHNKLTNLTLDLFAECKLLKEIDLSNNQLEILLDDLFKECEQLRYPNFSHNKLTTLPVDLFIRCKQLEAVDFSFNQLSNIPANIFRECKILRGVNFSTNQLTNLPTNLFKHCNELIEVNCSSNKIDSLNYALFEGLNKELILDFRNNVDMNDLEKFFKVFFSIRKIIPFSKEHYILKELLLDFDEKKVYLMRSSSQQLPFKLVLLLLNGRCFKQADLYDESKLFKTVLKKFIGYEITLLDFFMLADFADDFTSDFLLSLKSYVKNLMKENLSIVNYELRFKSTESVIEMCKRNDIYLFDKVFSFKILESLNELYESQLDKDNHKLNLRRDIDKRLVVIKAFVFDKNFEEFFLQINYIQCFRTILMNKNEHMAIHLLLIIKFIVSHQMNQKEQSFDEIIAKNKYLEDFNYQFLKKFFKAILKLKLKKLIAFILDNYQRDKQFLLESWTFNKANKIFFKNKVSPDESEHSANNNNNETCDVLYHLSGSKENYLLRHKITKKLLMKRWRTSRYFYYSNLLSYIIFLVFYSINIEVYNDKQRSSSIQPQLEMRSRIIAFILLVFFVLAEGVQVWFSLEKDLLIYFTSFKNLIELINYPLCIASLWIFSYDYDSFQLKSAFYSSTIILSYLILIFKLDKIATVGAYVNVFGKILRRSLHLLFIAFICLIGFLLAFRNRARPFSVDDSADNLMTPFNTTFSSSFITVTTMAIGQVGVSQLGIENITHQNIINLLIYIVFIFIIPIVLLNIFTAISVDEVNKLIENSEIESITIKIEYVLKYEAFVRDKKFLNFIHSLMKIIDNFEKKISLKLRLILKKDNTAVKWIRKSYVKYEQIAKLNEKDVDNDELEQRRRNDLLSTILLRINHLEALIHHQSNEEISQQSIELNNLILNKQSQDTRKFLKKIAKVNRRMDGKFENLNNKLTNLELNLKSKSDTNE